MKATVTGPHVCGHLCKLFAFLLRIWFRVVGASGGLRIWVQSGNVCVRGVKVRVFAYLVAFTQI